MVDTLQRTTLPFQHGKIQDKRVHSSSTWIRRKEDRGEAN